MNYSQVLLTSFHRYADRAALRAPGPDGYHTLSYSALEDRCCRIAQSLLERGLKPGQSVVIFSENRLEWVLAYLGALLAGGRPCAIYATSTRPEACHILQELEADFLFAENAPMLERIRPWPRSPAVFLFQPHPDYPAFSELLGSAPAARATLEQIAGRIEPDDVLTVIYTSGTTGVPKGAMLSHRNFLDCIDHTFAHLGSPDFSHNLTFLPLAHALERCAALHTAFRLGRCLALAESVERLPQNLRQVQPQVLTVVPRFLEKIREGVGRRLSSQSKWALTAFEWSLSFNRRQRGIWWTWPLRWALDRVFFAPIRAGLGGQLRFILCGSAPLHPDMVDFFDVLGIPILEGWGMTECTAVATLNTLEQSRRGSVGRPVPGVTVRAAADGELEISGPNVFLGYWKRPQDSAEIFTPDGFLRTGDLGRIDEDGFVFLTGRKKHLIILSTGKKVTPAVVEGLLLQEPCLDIAYLHGNNRKYLTALFTIHREALFRALPSLRGLSRTDLCQHPMVIEHIRRHLGRVNQELPHHAQIKDFRLIPEEFTVESGHLTPTMKLKKEVVVERYAPLLDSMYS